jgi:glutaredoxin
MADIKIYSTGWCAYCKQEMRFLDEHKVAYSDVNVEEDEAAAKEMVELSQQMGVPFTVITHEDGTKATKVGFDQAWLVEQLQLA